MEDKDIFTLRVAPLTHDNYLACSQHIEIIRRGKVLCRQVESWSTKTSKISVEQGNDIHANDPNDESNEISEKKGQKCYLALAYIMTTLRQKCTALVRKMRCSAEVWTY